MPKKEVGAWTQLPNKNQLKIEHLNKKVKIELA